MEQIEEKRIQEPHSLYTPEMKKCVYNSNGLLVQLIWIPISYRSPADNSHIFSVALAGHDNYFLQTRLSLTISNHLLPLPPQRGPSNAGVLELCAVCKVGMDLKQLGNECFKRQDYEGALSYYGKALKAKPTGRSERLRILTTHETRTSSQMPP